MIKETIIPIFLATVIALLLFVGVFFTACTLKNPHLWKELLQNEHYTGVGSEEGRKYAFIDAY